MRPASLIGFLVLLCAPKITGNHLQAFLTCDHAERSRACKTRPKKTELQGKWKVLSQEVGGESSKPFDLVVSIDGDKLTYDFSFGIKDEFEFIIDANKKPKHIDLIWFDDETKTTKRLVGIYEFRNDSLVLCLRPEEEKRPTEFLTKKGDGRNLDVLRRGK